MGFHYPIGDEAATSLKWLDGPVGAGAKNTIGHGAHGANLLGTMMPNATYVAYGFDLLMASAD